MPILMDLGGPKLRTELLCPGPTVLRLKPKRDDDGRVIEPARVGLRREASAPPIDGATTQAIADSDWLAGRRVRDVIVLTDARAKRRELIVERSGVEGALLKCSRTAHLTPKTELAPRGRGRATLACRLSALPHEPAVVQFARGAPLRLVAGDVAVDKRRSKSSNSVPTIGCTLPEVFVEVRKGERVWFDDGSIGGVIRATSAAWIEVEITDASAARSSSATRASTCLTAR